MSGLGAAMYGAGYSPASSTTTDPGYGAWADFSFTLGAGAAAQSAIGAYYAAESQKYVSKSQALDMDFARTMSNINARSAEQEANAILDAGQREAGRVAGEYEQAKQGFVAQQGASGLTMEGSNAEVAASIELAKQQDVDTISANSIRAAAARRAEATDQRNRGRIAGVSAQNLRGTADSISPAAQAGATLLGQASVVAPQWLYRRGRRY